eukprot:GHVR01030393.1.p1 GENE.GHVR01030393.1~~GHVR01030393.1.p1  ORF type:complete len:366 (+),score=72.84 GHVR01030393.1:1002-2099(+)
MRFCKAIEGEICFSKSLVHETMKMYNQRYNLHKDLYGHKKVRSSELMLLDALKEVSDLLNVWGSLDDPQEFLKLDDYIINSVTSFQHFGVRRLMVDEEEAAKIEKAAAIIQRVRKRELYVFVGESKPDPNYMELIRCRDEVSIEEKVLRVNDIHFGMKGKDPLRCVSFYDPYNEERVAIGTADVCVKQHIIGSDHGLYPNRFQESQLLLYVKNPLFKKTAHELFNTFLENKGGGVLTETIERRPSLLEYSGLKQGYRSRLYEIKRAAPISLDISSPPRKRLNACMGVSAGMGVSACMGGGMGGGMSGGVGVGGGGCPRIDEDMTAKAESSPPHSPGVAPRSYDPLTLFNLRRHNTEPPPLGSFLL